MLRRERVIAALEAKAGRFAGYEVRLRDALAAYEQAFEIVQNRVAESVESVGRDLLQKLPTLSKGQEIIADAAVSSPVLCVPRAEADHRSRRRGGECPRPLAGMVRQGQSSTQGRYR